MSKINRSGRNFSQSARYAILQRDNYTCRYCGASAPEAKLHVDHVTPVALGGTNDPANGVTACSNCNGGKSATPPPSETVQKVADQQQRVRDMVSCALGYEPEHGVSKEEYVENFDSLWKKVGLDPDCKPSDYSKTLTNWMNRGVPWPMVREAFAITYNWAAGMGDREIEYDWFYRYFCKIVWTHLKNAEFQVRTSIRLTSI